MEFLKKHYEKLLLGLVLLGLAVAVGFLPFKIAGDQKALEDKRNSLLRPRVQPLTNLDMTVSEQALKRVATAAVVDFGAPNRLYNAMPWKRSAAGQLIPAQTVGPSAVTVTNITPLYLKLSLDNITPSVDGVKYVIGIEKQAAATAGQRAKKQAYCTLNPPTKNDTFKMLEVKGKPEDPTQIAVQLNDSSETAVITKDKPFKRVDGYTADLRYELEKKSWTTRRVGAILTFNNEDYKIVAINQNEVVLSAPNQKKWTIKYSPSGTP